ncbi:hypothetical protein [Bartonella taylorii]|nr:hypothetical protein [Bartonella taylorii]
MRAKRFGVILQEAKILLLVLNIEQLYYQGQLSQEQYGAVQQYL